MNWHEVALNPQALDNLYKNVPTLEIVELFSFELNREGSRIRILFNLPSFPDYPAKRWHEEFNSVQIQLAFFGITNFQAKGWETNMKVKIEIIKEAELLQVTMSCSEINLYFSFSCDFLRIENISAYQNINL